MTPVARRAATRWDPALIAEAIVGWGCIAALVVIVRFAAEILRP